MSQNRKKSEQHGKTLKRNANVLSTFAGVDIGWTLLSNYLFIIS